MGEIYSAICNVMNDIGAVGKDGTNTQGRGYKYRSIEAVMNALHPAMVKHGVFCIPEVLEQIREERTTSSGGALIYSLIKVKYDFYAKDGSSVTATVMGEAFDSGDKATNKAMSAAFKYACFQTFCIPTEEMIDSEIESPEPTPKKKAPTQTTNQKEETNEEEPLASQAQINAIARVCEKRNINLESLYQQHGTTPEKCTKKTATAILTRLNK